MTDDRLVRARAVLDERERLARGAICGDSGVWWAGERDRRPGVTTPNSSHSVVGTTHTPSPYTDQGTAEHIAASDPGTVLREVAGWRKVLEMHCPVTHAGICAACGLDPDPDGMPQWQHIWPCPTVLIVLTALGVAP